MGGTTIREGRVDFCTQGHWASVCYNEDLELAGTVCKMLGFPMQGNNAQDYLRNVRMFIQEQWRKVLTLLLIQKSTVQ